MFAHGIVDFTGPDDVQWAEADEPAADGGVLIDVAAAGVSFADLLQTRGAYQMKVPRPYTPGMDAAGVVRSAPPGTGLVRTSGRHRGRPGRRGPDDRPPSLAGTRRPPRCRGIDRGRDPRRQGEPAPAGQHQRAGRRFAGVRRAASGHAGRPVGPAGHAAAGRNAARPSRRAIPFADGRSALRAIADRKAQGKIVLNRQA